VASRCKVTIVCGGVALLSMFQGGMAGATTKPQAPPSITSQPQNLTAKIGHGARFRVRAEGKPKPSVQWQASSDGGPFMNIDATGSTLDIPATPADDGNQFHAIVSNLSGSVTSDQATLTVVAKPSKACRASPRPNVDLSDCDLSGMNFSDADLSGANLSSSFLEDVDFDGANLNGVDLDASNASGSDFAGSTLRGASLDGGDFSSTDLAGVISTGLTGTPGVLPSGFQIDDGSLIGPGTPTFLIGPDFPTSDFVTATLTNEVEPCSEICIDIVTVSGSFDSAQTGPATFTMSPIEVIDGGCGPPGLTIDIETNSGDSLSGSDPGFCYEFNNDLFIPIDGGSGIFAGASGSILIDIAAGRIGAELTGS
jgi:uncharacterized protein YjbI with pentapeptide repeats